MLRCGWCLTASSQYLCDYVAIYLSLQHMTHWWPTICQRCIVWPKVCKAVYMWWNHCWDAVCGWRAQNAGSGLVNAAITEADWVLLAHAYPCYWLHCVLQYIHEWHDRTCPRATAYSTNLTSRSTRTWTIEYTALYISILQRLCHTVYGVHVQ